MDEEAEKRAGYDDYLFDIGKNHDSNTSIDEGLNNCEDAYDESGFAIDAAKYGNVGRFIDHSCSPNIYAQKILYDQRMRAFLT
uniref:SET domain-containing protein n=1 Tax=Cannabis sativa TaxID=3483 RepID=A0A803Q1Y1_CANSA